MTIRQDIAAKIAEINPLVKDRAVEAIVEREVAKRANTIVSGLDKLRTLNNDLKKIKPDQIVYDGEGKVQSEGWTQAQLKKLAEAKAACKKLDAAIEKALNGDLGDLNNIVGKG